MIEYCINEDKLPPKLPVIFSKKITNEIDVIGYYNRNSDDKLSMWHDYLNGIMNYISNPAIAWDNTNRYIHFPNGATYIKDFDFNYIKTIIDRLPYRLTNDQLKAIEEIVNDLEATHRMNRLLQGDVGSGKTVVAFTGMFVNYLSGYQSALMAPTEILAMQHYLNLKKFLEKEDIRIELLTGSTPKKEKADIYKGLK